MALLNPGFELWTAGAPDNWSVTIAGLSTVTQDTTNQRSGASCASIFESGSGSRLDQTMSATPGLIYTSSFWFKAVAGNFPFMRINCVGGASNGFYVQNDTLWGAAFNQFSATNGNGAYRQVSQVAQALPAGATGVMVGIGGATIFLDDVDISAPAGITARQLGLTGVGT